jgi:hypothetical protein
VDNLRISAVHKLNTFDDQVSSREDFEKALRIEK